MTFSLSITDSPSTGLFVWELRDQGLIAGGQAPTVERCISEVTRARLVIENHVQRRHAHASGPSFNFHPSSEPPPILQVHTPGGDPLPAQQDIPSIDSCHSCQPAH